MNLTLTPLKIKISLRREIRLALLAAMEACWVYAVFALVASLIVVTPPTVFSIFLAYWIALIIGRIAPRVRMPWVQVQIVVLAFALATAFYLGWIELYARQFLFDPNWIAQFTRALTELGNGLSRAHLIAAAVVYTFVRGLGFAERPLTLWFIGFQFRLGIVFFFFVLIASAFLKPLDLSAWILVYFILSLFAIALARIDEMGSDLPVGPRWAIFLLAAVGLVIFLGLAGVRVFTLEALQGSLSMLTPLWNVIQFLFLLFIIPASFVVEFLYTLLLPLIVALRRMLEQMAQVILPPENRPEPEQLQPVPPAFEILIPLIKTIAVLLILFAIGLWIANSIQRRMRQYEEENFVREGFDGAPVGASDPARAKKKTPRRAFDGRAESIRRIYAALVARAGAAGVTRATAETPNEYLPRLTRAWDEHTADLETITRAYIAAHYGEEPPPVDLVARVRAAWQRVERALQKKN